MKKRLPKKNIKRGGDDLERLYLYTVRIVDKDGDICVTKSCFPQTNSMEDVVMRHIGRYGFVLPFIRPGFRVLDFPCGSGLALEILGRLHTFGEFLYEGWEFDEQTVIYCRSVYSKYMTWAKFAVNDLTIFTLPESLYNTIFCIEGIEHIGNELQRRAIKEFYRGLKPGGTLIISSPSPEGGISGPNPKNIFHLWELTKNDFKKILLDSFGMENIEIISQENVLSTDQRLICFYAVCHKNK